MGKRTKAPEDSASLHNADYPGTQKQEAPERRRENRPRSSRSELSQHVAAENSTARPVNSSRLNIPEHAFSATVEVLQRARRMVARGWVQHCQSVDARGETFSGYQRGGAIAWSLDGAVSSAGRGGIEAEYGRRALRVVVNEHNLHQWNDWPLRRQSAVLWALDEAIKLLGGPRLRRGGWAVGERRAS